jgi:mannose-1-phosphate guanylyltransferase/mannose-6-phosphate isomerase
MDSIMPVILAGGAGTRLWPQSRTLRPKQFLELVGSKSMLQNTLLRLESIPNVLPPIVICNEEHRFIVAEQMRKVGVSDGTIILEPCARDTAPAIAIASFVAKSIAGNIRLLVLAADHDIKNVDAFVDAVDKAAVHSEKGNILTFGIVPKSAHTGYGYIHTESSATDIKSVKSFVEKPDAQTAEEYLKTEDYYWNSGMFLFSADIMLEAFNQYSSELLGHCQAAFAQSEQDKDFIRLNEAEFEKCSAVSIDYCIMEHASNIALVPLDAGWSDVGDWESLWNISDKDAQGNVCIGDVITHDSSNSYIRANQKLVAAVGVDNLVIVETKDAILIADKSSTQNVKQVVAQLKQQGRYETKHHRLVHRPWGSYDSIDAGGRFQVKRIVVNPGAKLSVQMHHHRAEHWIVVKGTAMVTRGEEISLLAENQSVYIPLGVVHALENPGKIPLEIIEVQTGSYLGEDDIVRYEDRYGRTPKVSSVPGVQGRVETPAVSS